MKSHALALAVVLSVAACTDDAPGPGLGNTRVETTTIPGRGLAQLDVLVVIDDTTAMASYRDAVAAVPAIVDTTFGAVDRGLLDLRIAVTSNDGMFHRTPSMAEPFLAVRTDFDLVRTTNFEGTLAEELAALVDVGAASTGPSTLLDAATRALAADEGGFHRDDAMLGVVFLTASDDASPSPVASYALHADVVSAIAPTSAARYGELLAASPGARYSIDAADHAPAFEELRGHFTSILPGMCLHATDVDPVAAGAQYDCTVTALVRDQELVLPPCKLDSDLLCWRLRPSQSCGEDPSALALAVPVFWFYVSYPTIRLECVVE